MHDCVSGSVITKCGASEAYERSMFEVITYVKEAEN